MKAWKVLYDNKYSCLARGMACIVYFENKPVTAPEWLAEKGYHLTAFNTLRNARNLIEELSQYPEFTFKDRTSIWEVEGEEQILPLPSMAFLDFLMDGYIIKNDNPDWYWPLGTLMFKKITLIKKVV